MILNFDFLKTCNPALILLPGHIIRTLCYRGPGFECQRPAEASGWISKACEEYRVILMDQACYFEAPFMFRMCRGTGLLTPSSMSQFKSAEELANYLRHFRADNIVNDAEFIRKRLVPDFRPWTMLGQVPVAAAVYYKDIVC
ncbi:hypothetical protein Pfo_001151 [Paulownia fortunei]|nr:hypothetical protein Pfo_001151 [Paulownia fortunei]